MDGSVLASQLYVVRSQFLTPALHSRHSITLLSKNDGNVVH